MEHSTQNCLTSSSVSWETKRKSNVWARLSQSTSGGDQRHHPVRLGVDGNWDSYSSWDAWKLFSIDLQKGSFLSLWAHGLALYLIFRLAVHISPLSRDALGHSDFISREAGGLLGRRACRGKTQAQIIKHCSHIQSLQSLPHEAARIQCQWHVQVSSDKRSQNFHRIH